jgi:RimJ/RimL family protein N-acetyltransferase
MASGEIFVTATTETITLRPLEPGDEEAVLAFARALPAHDLLFARRDLTQPRVIRAWFDAVAASEIHSQVAVTADGRIAGYSALISDPHSWSAHVGEIRIMVGEGFRGQHLGRRLAEAAFAKALELGLEKLTASMTVDQHGAIALFEDLGFRGEALLRDHVRTPDGETCDLAILSHEIAEGSARRSMLGMGG